MGVKGFDSDSQWEESCRTRDEVYLTRWCHDSDSSNNGGNKIPCLELIVFETKKVEHQLVPGGWVRRNRSGLGTWSGRWGRGRRNIN